MQPIHGFNKLVLTPTLFGVPKMLSPKCCNVGSDVKFRITRKKLATIIVMQTSVGIFASKVLPESKYIIRKSKYIILPYYILEICDCNVCLSNKPYLPMFMNRLIFIFQVIVKIHRKLG